jgi:hypothetical protein
MQSVKPEFTKHHDQIMKMRSLLDPLYPRPVYMGLLAMGSAIVVNFLIYLVLRYVDFTWLNIEKLDLTFDDYLFWSGTISPTVGLLYGFSVRKIAWANDLLAVLAQYQPVNTTSYKTLQDSLRNSNKFHPSFVEFLDAELKAISD